MTARGRNDNFSRSSWYLSLSSRTNVRDLVVKSVNAIEKGNISHMWSHFDELSVNGESFNFEGNRK
jgi:hypothetical protein